MKFILQIFNFFRIEIGKPPVGAAFNAGQPLASYSIGNQN
jgi:hypothetical protein